MKSPDLDTFGENWVADMHEADPHYCCTINPIEEYLDIKWWMQQNEIAFTSTGGGCTALTAAIKKKRCIIITALDGLSHPVFKDQWVTVGIYDDGFPYECCDIKFSEFMEVW